MSSSRRNEIVKVFTRKYNLVLKADALAWLDSLCDEYGLTTIDDVSDTMETMAKELVSWEDGVDVVDVPALQKTYETLRSAAGSSTTAAAANDDLDYSLHDVSRVVKVVDSFSMPQLHFNPDRKTFQQSSSAPHNIGAPESKAMYLRDQYNLLKQIILRNEHFSPPALPGHDRDNYMKLTTIKNLLGRQGERFLLFGLLTRNEKGIYVLEDLEDQIELDLDSALPASGLFTEGSFVLADGDYTIDGNFKVHELGHPPSEARHVARSIFGHIDFMGNGALSLGDEKMFIKVEKKDIDAQIVVISDFHLDNPLVLKNFLKILGVYEHSSPPIIPVAFVLCGNFSSKPFLNDGICIKSYAQNFERFADQVSSVFPQMSQQSHFIFVPGPNDPWVTNTLPRKGLPKALVGSKLDTKFQHYTLASNPCRISYLAHEIVVMRDDIRSRMLRNTVLLKEQAKRDADENENDNDEDSDQEKESAETKSSILERYLVQTIIDQANLSPLSIGIRPVIWERSQSLRLYPLPTTIILADKCSPYEVTYDLGSGGDEDGGNNDNDEQKSSSCHVFNPGPFVGSKFAWTTYFVATRTSERSVLSE